jgi:ribosomal protein S18 acetylase RimI-like enzyme
MRPLNILRDLPQVADLIELCFEMSIDDDGQSYVQQMRKASTDGDFLAWASKLVESTSMPLAGYVWEEDGKIIGNASLVFQAYRGRKMAMIANVATHPDHRRHGIGRALTERALLSARQKGTHEVWLQVRHDNPTAIGIYAALGFEERARRTTYSSRSALGVPAGEPPIPAAEVTRQRSVTITHGAASQYWPRQRAWLEQAHPEELGWYARWDWKRLGPGLSNAFYRMFSQYDIRQWVGNRAHEPVASVSWVPTYRVPNSLWLAAAPDAGVAITKVLEAARRDLAHYRKVTVEYPANEFREEIEAAGFEHFRTLLWMRATQNGANTY